MSEIGAITQGMQSVQGTGMYTARLDAFTKNAKAFEAYDFNKGFESEAAKKQKDAATFAEVALGFKTVPNSNNLYNKHHALLSKKYDLLFDDANISAMAATPEGRAAFDRAVQQLQQETKAYENIYAATFGDPNKADGTGITYADHLQRKRSGGSRDFFGLKGVSIDRDDQYFENRLIDLDTADDFSSLTFNPQTGQWEGVSQVGDLSLDMGTASQYFTYTMSQASFNSPSTYAQDKPLYEMYSGQGENSIRENLQLRREQLELEAVAYYQSTLKDDEDGKNLTVQQYRDKLINSGTIGRAHETFENAVISGLEERKKREEAEKRKAQRANRSNKTTPDPDETDKFNVTRELTGEIQEVVNGIAKKVPITYDEVDTTGIGKIAYNGQQLSVGGVSKDTTGNFYVKLIDSSGGVRMVKFVTDDNTDKQLQTLLKKSRGEDSVEQIKTLLGAGTGSSNSGILD